MNASWPLGPETGVTTGGVVKIIGTAPAPNVRLKAVFVGVGGGGGGTPKGPPYGGNETFQPPHPKPKAEIGSQMPASQNQLEYSGCPNELTGPA